MRFVFIDNDTRLLFCTSFDGDWDYFIDDFGTKIPDELDALFSEAVGLPRDQVSGQSRTTSRSI